MLSKLAPIPVKAPENVILNSSLSKELGLDFSNTSNENLASIFSGNLLPEGSDAIAQAYAGHQFGHFVIDGGIGKKQMGDYQMINPDEIAKTYLDFHNQDKSSWSWEIELRTSVEKF